MSKAIDIANALKDRLTSDQLLEGVEVIVDRQRDIGSEVSKKVLMSGAILVVILYQGFANPDERYSGLPSVIRRYTVTVYSRPVMLSEGEMPADDVVEAVARRLHNWDADEATEGLASVIVTFCDMRPDQKHLIYDLDVEAQSSL